MSLQLHSDAELEHAHSLGVDCQSLKHRIFWYYIYHKILLQSNNKCSHLLEYSSIITCTLTGDFKNTGIQEKFGDIEVPNKENEGASYVHIATKTPGPVPFHHSLKAPPPVEQ